METFRKAREIKLGPLLLLVGFANQTSINLSSTAVFAAVAKQSNRCSKTSFPCEELLLLLVVRRSLLRLYHLCIMWIVASSTFISHVFKEHIVDSSLIAVHYGMAVVQ
ncbi:hypothetical protein QQP08_004779, partial [Theobroma cacao]